MSASPQSWREGLDRRAAIVAGVAALAGPEREIPADDLEVAALTREGARRCFRRLDHDGIVAALG